MEKDISKHAVTTMGFTTKDEYLI